MQFITDIKIISGKKSNIEAPAGYHKHPQDLNEGAKGKYIYLCYKKEEVTKEQKKQVITDLKASTSNNVKGYTKLDADLNEGAGGEYIYLYYKTEEYQENTSGIIEIKTIKGKNEDAPEGYTKLFQDLNEGAGGKYIYLCFKKNMPFTTSSDSHNHKVKYQISFHTADEYKAGTDSNIFIQIRGELGQSKEYRTNYYLKGNAFERNDVDTFILELDENLGRIYELKIRSDMLYAGAGWRLNQVFITQEGSNQTSTFNVFSWIEDKSTHTYYDKSAIGNINTSFEDKVIQNEVIHSVPAGTTITIEDTCEMQIGYLLSETKVQEITTTSKIGGKFEKMTGTAAFNKNTLGANLEFALSTKNSNEDTSQISANRKVIYKQSATFEKCDHARRFKAEYVQRIEHNTIQLGSLEMSVPNVLNVRTIGFKEVFED